MDIIDYINEKDTPESKTPTYERCVLPYIKDFIKIDFFEDELIPIREFSKKVIKEKMKEEHYQKDYGSLEKRFFTGFLGELALSMILEDFKIDLSVGDSFDFNFPDIKKYNLGIKTVEWGKFPLIHKKPKRKEVINLLDGNTIYVCGIASIESMLKNSSDDLILSPNLRERNVKTGFYGFKDLRFLDKEKIYKKLNRGS
ncbi:hypothetical protein N9948_00825 [bacterium]|nr:hypothetical protein [bacterium]